MSSSNARAIVGYSWVLYYLNGSKSLRILGKKAVNLAGTSLKNGQRTEYLRLLNSQPRIMHF